MPADPQLLAALLFVAAAAGVVARRAWRLVRAGGETGCGAGCGSCPANRPAGPAVVTLDLPAKPR